MSSDVLENYSVVLERVAAACRRAGRDPSEVTIVAVSKKQPEAIVQAFISAANHNGHTPCLGENYVQEFKKKRALLQGRYGCHLIGPLQSNKIRDALRIFDVIESAHNLETAQLIDIEAKKAGKIQDVFLQINVSKDQAKHGFSPHNIASAVEVVRALANLRLLGLMTITRFYERADDARGDFAALRLLRDKFIPSAALSMGMSSDFEVAVEEGATHIRVGTAIFGERAP